MPIWTANAKFRLKCVKKKGLLQV